MISKSKEAGIDTEKLPNFLDKIYEEGIGNEWRWDTTENRLHFDKLRIRSVTYDKYAQFAIGGLILHRIVSLIDIVYLERQLNISPEFSSNSANLKLKKKCRKRPDHNGETTRPLKCGFGKI